MSEQTLTQLIQNRIDNDTFYDDFDGIDVVLYNSAMQPLDQQWIADKNPLDPTLYWGGFKIGDYGVRMTVHKNGLLTSDMAGHGKFRGQYKIDSLDFQENMNTNQTHVVLGINMKIDLSGNGADTVFAGMDGINIKRIAGEVLDMEITSGYMKFVTFPPSVAHDFFMQDSNAKSQAEAGTFEPTSVAAAYGPNAREAWPVSVARERNVGCG